MSRHGFPVERSIFTVERVEEFDRYVLFSSKYQRNYEVNIYLYDNVKCPEAGDILELPDCMLRMDEGYVVFSNKQLQFGLPNDNIAIPAGFNIEDDYAYITYRKDNKRELVQRLYG